MITESDARRYDSRTNLVWSLCASLLVNLLAWMLGLWLSGLNFIVQPTVKNELEVSSSSASITRRIQPQPRAESVLAQPPQPRVQQQVTRPKPEVAIPRPIVQEPAKTLAQQLAQQQQTFAKTVQQLRAQSQTLSNATPAPIAPSTYHRSYMDLSGRNPQESVQAVLYPVGPHSHWIENGMSCYYVHYYAQYSGGGNEEGNIPWPVCYPANHDLMIPMDGHALPIPLPPLGYVLPPGTPLAPMLERIYTSAVHR